MRGYNAGRKAVSQHAFDLLNGRITNLLITREHGMSPATLDAAQECCRGVLRSTKRASEGYHSGAPRGNGPRPWNSTTGRKTTTTGWANWARAATSGCPVNSRTTRSR